MATPNRRLGLVSLGHSEASESAADVFRVAAERIASQNDPVTSEYLLDRMTAPDGHSANLRGKLLLMEIECPALASPYAFYLLRTAAEVTWRGAPLRLFLFGLYRPEAIRAYIPASSRLYEEKLTPENTRRWLAGDAWPRQGDEPGPPHGEDGR